MNKSIALNKNYLIFGIPLSLLFILVFFIKSKLFIDSNSLNFAITFDLLLSIPLIYFLLIRKTAIPNSTVVPVMLVGFLVGTFFLPESGQTYLSLFKTWVFPVMELAIITFVIIKVRKAQQHFKRIREYTFDFYTALQKAVGEILPRAVAIAMVTEIAVFYYGFIDWKKRKLQEGEFSYHKETSTVILFIMLIFLIVIETFVLHLLIQQWSHVTAWILTVLSIYTGVQIMGFLKSIQKRPISIEAGKLFLRYGILNETTIDLASIASVEYSSREPELNSEVRKLSLLGDMEGHNVIIHLKEENTLTGLYGFKKSYKTLAFHVDQKNEFKEKLDAHLSPSFPLGDFGRRVNG